MAVLTDKPAIFVEEETPNFFLYNGTWSIGRMARDLLTVNYVQTGDTYVISHANVVLVVEARFITKK